MSAAKNDFEPFLFAGRLPVYGTTILVALHVAAFVLTAICLPLGLRAIPEAMMFSSSAVIGDFAIWQIGTYAFVHQPSLWFLIELAMLYFFGLEVEKFLGRTGFFVLYALLVLVPPLFLVAAGLFGTVSVLQGASAANFAVFAAFAVIYPDARIFFNLSARLLAIAFFAFNSLVLFSQSSWSALSALWMDAGAMLFFLRIEGVRSLQGALPVFQPPVRKGFAGLATVRKAASEAPLPLRKNSTSTRDPMMIIDPILDKIAREGIGSLSEAEKKRLEEARADLVKREKREKSGRDRERI